MTIVSVPRCMTVVVRVCLCVGGWQANRTSDRLAPDPAKWAEDDAIINLHAQAAAVLLPVKWPKFRAQDFSQFLDGYALAGVNNNKTRQAVVPPGHVALPVSAMLKSEGITPMFQSLFDTVHFSQVGMHMPLAPCVVELHCPFPCRGQAPPPKSDPLYWTCTCS